MEGSSKDRSMRLSKPTAGMSLSNNTSITSPSNFSSSNFVIQTATSKPASRNETDLQKAISEYQAKVHKTKAAKKTTGTSRTHGKSGNQEYPKNAPLSQKKLADTYMVGGCSMDLNNTYSTQK